MTVEILHDGCALRIDDSPNGSTLLYRRQLGGDFQGAKLSQRKILEASQHGQTIRFHDSQGEYEYELGSEQAPTLLHNCRVFTGRPGPASEIASASILIQGQEILWVREGKATDLPPNTQDFDLGRRLVTPGLIDSHTHPVFAGDRADEFARRARGENYLEIAAAGGGINATLEPTRRASLDEHIDLCGARVHRMLRSGTTTLEAKTGYDLTEAGELRLLEVIRQVGMLQDAELVPTLLAAHLIPPEFRDKRDDYVSLICQRILPKASAEYRPAVDVYCDEGAYTLAETEQILVAAQRLGLPIKAHVGQFADLGGPELLARLGAVSADHLEVVSDEGIAAMAQSAVVATMLPAACVQLKMQPPPVEALRSAGVAMALASDLNPGSSNSENLALSLWLACTHYGMWVEEAWDGVTGLAASVLGLDRHGKIDQGMQADLVVWNAESPAEVAYHFGVPLVERVMKRGRWV